MKSYIVIVAHPDDEILFFSSLLAKARKVLICFGPSYDKVISSGRRALKKDFPLSNVVFLDNRGANVHKGADWNKPVLIREGIKTSRNLFEYKSNFYRLKRGVEKHLKRGERIFTHNPWGEYGHEEHVQVLAVVRELSENFKSEIFVTGYVSDRSFNLMKMTFANLISTPIIATPPLELCSKIKELYKKNKCWTWYDDYQWPKLEIFFPYSPTSINNETTTSYPPLSFIQGSFKTNFAVDIIKAFLRKILPIGIKKVLKMMINRKAK